MIRIFLKKDTKEIEVGIKTITYPDGTKSHILDLDFYISEEAFSSCIAKVYYYYESPADYIDIASIIMTLKEHPFVKSIYLYISYMPNARMDRVKNIGETFTLKAFTSLINALPIDNIYVFDPHSSVSELLLNKVSIYTKQFMDEILIHHLKSYIEDIFPNNDSFYIAFPDEGAQKRYIDKCCFGSKTLGIFTGEKIRDWNTGVIQDVSVRYSGEEPPQDGKSVIIIDDICSKGGTFKYFIKAIKNNWPINLNYYLYVSHLEPTVLEGDLLTDESLNLVKILTTNSLKYLWKSRGLDISKYEKITMKE